MTKQKKIFRYFIMTFFGLVMIYPIIWLFLASFKTNEEIFGTHTPLLPSSFSPEAYIKGWQGSGTYTYTTFFLNTFKMVIPTVVFTLISTSLVSYGFARFRFPLKKILFTIMILTLMLPNSVIIIPRYLLFKKLGWLNSYLPWIAPAALACYPFFIFQMIQFFRGIPQELDEAAKIDGCSAWNILIHILLPLCKPALFSVGLFQCIWTWNDFFNSMIFINSVDRYTLTLGLRMSLDTQAAVNWNQVMAMAIVTMIPLIILFFAAQKYFVEGISTAGLKG